MTYEQLAGLVAEPEDLDQMLEDLLDNLQLIHHLDALSEEDVWGWR